MYAEVLIEYNAKSVDKTFTYLIPDSLKEELKVGMKVVVPFATKKINGFVIKIKNEFDCSYELKEIDSIVDKFLCLNEELIELGKYLQSKTLCSKITAYQTMLPSSLKVKDQQHNYSKYLEYVSLSESNDKIEEYIEKHKSSKRQIAILEELKKRRKNIKDKISVTIFKNIT